MFPKCDVENKVPESVFVQLLGVTSMNYDLGELIAKAEELW